MAEMTLNQYCSSAREILDRLEECQSHDLNSTTLTWAADRIAKLEAAPAGMASLTVDCCKEMRRITEGLWRFRAELIQASPEKRQLDPFPVSGEVAAAIRAVQDYGWAEESPLAEANGKHNLVSLAEAGRLFDVNKGTLSRAANRGEIKDNGITGRGRMLSQDSVFDWIRKRSHQDRTESTAAVERKMAAVGIA